MPGQDTVLIERDGPVTIVTINRPERRNAVDGATAKNCTTPSWRSMPTSPLPLRCSPARAARSAPGPI